MLFSQATFPCLIVILICIIMTASSNTINQDKIAISKNKSIFLSNPGEKDAWYESMTSAELKSYWSNDDDIVFNKKMKQIRDFETMVFVEIKLVGFNGEGYRRFTINEAELSRYLDATGLNMHLHPYIINNNLSSTGLFESSDSSDRRDHAAMDFSDTTSTNGSKLPVKRRYMFKVSKSNPDLSVSISTLIQSHVKMQSDEYLSMNDKKFNKRNSHLSEKQSIEDLTYRIPSHEITAILDQDYHVEKNNKYTIYILSPTAPSVTSRPSTVTSRSSTSQSDKSPVKYIYSHRDPNTSHVNLQDCDTSIFAADSRYAFIDLTAGPVSYGPKIAGDGIFTEVSLPRLDLIFSRHEEDQAFLSRQKTVRGDGSGDQSGMTKRNLHTDKQFGRGRGDVDNVINPNSYSFGYYGGKRRTHERGMNTSMSVEEKIKKDYLLKGLNFLTGVANTIRHTSDALFSPPLLHHPVTYYDRLLVQIITITDKDKKPTGNNANDLAHSKWKMLASELNKFTLQYQHVQIDSSVINFDECELCVTALTSSLKTYTTNVLNRNSLSENRGMHFNTKMQQFLDSSQMFDWLEHFETDFWKLKNEKLNQSKLAHTSRIVNTQYISRHTDTVSPDVSDSTIDKDNLDNYGHSTRVVTIFLYDLSSKDPLLFDRQHQVVSRGDTIVAVQVDGRIVNKDNVCNGYHLQLDTSDASRNILAELISNLFGVTPSGLIFNSFTNSTELDYMWAVGNTPFGVYSTSLHSHFGLIDSAQRNQVYGAITWSLDLIEDSRLVMKKYRKNIIDIATKEQYTHFLYRYNILSFKLKKTRYLMGVNNYNEALFYAKSSQHDALAIYKLIHDLLVNLHVQLVCSSDVNNIQYTGVIGLLNSGYEYLTGYDSNNIQQKELTRKSRAKIQRDLREQKLLRERDSSKRRNNGFVNSSSKTPLGHQMNDIEDYLNLIESYQVEQSRSISSVMMELALFLICIFIMGYLILIYRVSQGNNDRITQIGADIFDLNEGNIKKKHNRICNYLFNCRRKKINRNL